MWEMNPLYFISYGFWTNIDSTHHCIVWCYWANFNVINKLLFKSMIDIIKTTIITPYKVKLYVRFSPKKKKKKIIC
jgi:hypothetical protein